MSPSKSEEMLALLWFILATQLHGWMRNVCVFFGAFCYLCAIIYAITNKP